MANREQKSLRQSSMKRVGFKDCRTRLNRGMMRTFAEGSPEGIFKRYQKGTPFKTPPYEDKIKARIGLSYHE